MATGNCYTKVRGSCIFIVAVIIFTLSTEFAHCRTIDETVKDNKAVIKTIKGDGGDVIDCVDIYKQPALNHPLLKNHTIQLQPSYPSNETASCEGDEIFQDWQPNGECPEGTIPIVRTKAFDHAASKSIPQFNRTKLEFSPSLGHEYALVRLTGGKYYGARANLNIWSPKSFDQEKSIAQIWVVGGQGTTLSSVEAGWIMNSRDKQTRLFAFWTGDGYHRTGCYNLQCPGFVQTSRKFALGAAIRPISIYNGKQYDIFINIYKNINTGHWWLQVAGEVLGYWPDTILQSLKGGADLVSWGGEIVNLQAEGRHTSTQMGSGHFPSEGDGRASFMRNLQYYGILDASAGSIINKDPESLLAYVTKPTCYSLTVTKRTPVYGIHFYFGGPGFSNICP